jgi:ElaA protein
MKPLIWHIKEFKDISVDDLYKIVQLREQVFVVEQECVFLDADGLDFQAVHIFTKNENGHISAYLRVLPPGIPYYEPSIGRVVVAKESRGKYLGKELMLQGIEYIKKQYPGLNIRIAAQLYLDSFYTSLGFKAIEAPFLLDGINHQYMLL